MGTATSRFRGDGRLPRRAHNLAVPYSTEFLIFEDSAGDYNWRISGDDGLTLAHSGSFGCYEDAEQAARNVRDHAASALFPGEDLAAPIDVPSEDSDAAITIRPAYPDDDTALNRLARLDSLPRPPPAPALVAEVDGGLRAALSLRDGSAIADPFFPTAHLLSMLRADIRSETLAIASRRRSRWRRARSAIVCRLR